ncbi:hypothetical protein J7T55_006273 [Diaporthe amygdali]|uniref:uncharacterized protein n=1 Tax=Phomopsis amygdali TaxID=1214568 RepID=UPI0022FE8A9B|nr:uncharacterized protein J7T55_006273 [Diaporthe amygdali]KAJ0124930.1 hypothetical protein J7T55_006273 [Diaporthe amygdali]
MWKWSHGDSIPRLPPCQPVSLPDAPRLSLNACGSRPANSAELDKIRENHGGFARPKFRASEAPRCSPQEDKAAHHTETPPYALVLDDAF